MANPELKVAVLMGGIGSERQVSLMSGANIAAALREASVSVLESDITPDNLSILDDPSINVFFPALHGEFGEDGQVQEILEERNLVYVGSDSRASRLAFDKIAAKEAFRGCRLTVARDVSVTSQEHLRGLAEELAKVGEKFVVKPIKDGSSVGVEIVVGCANAADAARRCLQQYGDCMVEEFIAGREITIGIVNGQALPIIEIRSKATFYDYRAKYVDDATEYLFDTVDDKDTAARLQEEAVKCFEVLKCRHLARVDMILDDHNRGYILEINTLPGFTSHSLLPMAAAKSGLPLSQLCLEMVEAALKSFRK